RTFATQPLVVLVDQAVPGHKDVGAVAQEQTSAHLDAALFEVLDLLQHLVGVDDAAVADYAELVAIEDAGGDEVELELAELVDDGVAGVVASRITGHDVGLLREKVDYSSLPLISPLGAYDYYCGHNRTTSAWAGSPARVYGSR